MSTHRAVSQPRKALAIKTGCKFCSFLGPYINGCCASHQNARTPTPPPPTHTCRFCRCVWRIRSLRLSLSLPHPPTLPACLPASLPSYLPPSPANSLSTWIRSTITGRDGTASWARVSVGDPLTDEMIEARVSVGDPHEPIDSISTRAREDHRARVSAVGDRLAHEMRHVNRALDTVNQ